MFFLTKYVTVFEEVLICKDLKNTVRTFKCDHYPLNKFKLQCDHYGLYTEFNLYVSGPIIPEFHVIFSKLDGNKESEKFDLSGKTQIYWFPINPGHLVEDPEKEFSYFSAFNFKIEFSVPKNPIPTAKKERKCLGMFNNPVCNKFKICVEDETFHVSKETIAKSSKIFQSKFSELAENQEDKLVIDDLKANVVQKMLEFAYDENVELGKDMELIEKLLEAAEKYEIEKLKARCEAILITNINDSTACHYYGIAEGSNAHKLRKKVINYLLFEGVKLHQKNEFKQLLRTYPELSTEFLMIARSNSKTFLVVLCCICITVFLLFLFK